MISWFHPPSKQFMPHHFEAKAKTIDDLFAGEIKPSLHVPRFQRGYSWEKKHVDDFWKDLSAFISDKKASRTSKYFLGPIVTLEKDDQNVIEILDGQQRLATVTLLFAAIRDAAKEIGTDEFIRLANGIHDTFIAKMDAGDFKGYTLILGDLDRTFFRDTVQDETAKRPKSTVKSHRLIQNAYRILRANIDTKLAGTSATEKMPWLRELRDAIRADLIMTCIPVATEREAFQIFETLNDRGLRLSVPDLLLNYLMKTAEESQRAEIRTYWDWMTENMGQRSIGQFLRHVWVSEFGDLKKKDLFTALKDHLSTSGAVSLTFARQCGEQCESYCELLDADSKELGEKTAAHVRHLVRSLECESALPLLLSSYLTLSDSGFQKVCQWLLVFAVRHSVVAGMDSGDMEALFFSLAKEVRSFSTDKEAEKVIKEKECLARVKEELQKKNPVDRILLEKMQDLTLSPGAAPYVLAKMAERLHTSTREWKGNEITLEHIFPRRPASEWANAEELKPFLWNIGNLTIIGGKLNSSLANKGFASKKLRYGKSTEVEMSQEIARTYNVWDQATVKKRAVALGALLVSIWNFDNPSYV
jgi:hypothetical protein